MIGLKEIYSECFELLKDNTVVIQPLIFYTILVNLMLLPIGNTLDTQSIVVIAICFGITLVVFNSGWFNMFFGCIRTIPNPNLTKEESTLKSLELYNDFFPGVAMNFLPFLGAALINLLIFSGLIYLAYYLNADQLVIPQGFNLDQFLQSLEKYETSQSILNKMPEAWQNYIFFVMVINHILNFLTIFYFQLMVIDKTNPISGLIDSIKTVFSHPLQTFIIYISFNVALSISTLILLLPVCIFQFIGLVLYLISMTYFNLLIFLYLDKQTSNNNRRANCFR